MRTMNEDAWRLTEIAAYRSTLPGTDRAKVDYVVSHVAGIEVEHVKEMIEAGHSFDQIKAAVTGARQDEQQRDYLVRVTLYDEHDNPITVTVNPEQDARIRHMPPEKVQALAKTLIQQAAVKEREERAAQREQARKEQGMTKAQKEEAANDGWRVTKRYARSNAPKIAKHSKSGTRVMKSRAAVAHKCDLPACREVIEPGEDYLRIEVARPQRHPGAPYIPDTKVYHQGCVRTPGFAPAMKLLGLENTPVRVPKGDRLPSTSPSQQLKEFGQAVSDAFTQVFQMPHEVAEELAITRDDLEQAKLTARPQRDMRNIIIHHTAPSGTPEAQAHYRVDKRSTQRWDY